MSEWSHDMKYPVDKSGFIVIPYEKYDFSTIKFFNNPLLTYQDM